MFKIQTESVLCKGKNIAWKELDGESVILDVKSGNFFSVNETGIFIWKLFDGKRTLKSLALKLSSKYSIKERLALKTVLGYAGLLLKRRLVILKA